MEGMFLESRALWPGLGTQSVQTRGGLGYCCVFFMLMFLDVSHGTRPPPASYLTQRKVVCVFRVYLRVELQSGQKEDNDLELASRQTREVGVCRGASFPALGIESVMPPKLSWLH